MSSLKSIISKPYSFKNQNIGPESDLREDLTRGPELGGSQPRRAHGRPRGTYEPSGRFYSIWCVCALTLFFLKVEAAAFASPNKGPQWGQRAWEKAGLLKNKMAAQLQVDLGHLTVSSVHGNV